METLDELILVTPRNTQTTLRGDLHWEMDGFHWKVATDSHRARGTVEDRAVAIKDEQAVADGYVYDEEHEGGLTILKMTPERPTALTLRRTI